MYLEDVYYIGYSLSYLKIALHHFYPVKGGKYILEELKNLRYSCNQLNIDKSLINDISKSITELGIKYKDRQDIETEDAESLNEAIIGWYRLLEKEFIERNVEEIYKEGFVNWKYLYNVEKAFESNWHRLPDICKSDLTDASKCILLNIPTPAAMVTLRAIEKIIRTYYEYKTNNEPGKKSLATLIDELSQRNDINKSLIGFLDYIREQRNAAQHPEKIFTPREAERTFTTSVDIIEEIYRDM